MSPTAIAGRLQASSRAEQIVRRLRGLIDRGELVAGQRLPTERELATRFGVSVPTVNKAMAALAAGGYLMRQVGTGTSVALDAGRGAVALAFHTDLVERGPLFYRALINRLGVRFASAGFPIDLVLSPPDGDGGVDRGPLVRALARGRLVGIVSLGWSGEVAAMAGERGLPLTCIAVRPEGRGGFHLDYPGLVAQAVGHLAERGHRRIALITPELQTGLAGQIPSFRAAMSAHGLDAQAAVLADVADGRMAALAVQRLLADTAGVRALVVGDENLLEGIATALALLGRRTPDDLAVVSHATLGLESATVLNATRCGFALDDIADAIASRLLAAVAAGSGTPDIASIAIPARLITGSTT